MVTKKSASLGHLVLLGSLYIGENSTSYGHSLIRHNLSEEEVEERSTKKETRKKDEVFGLILSHTHTHMRR